jgi:dTDP-4-amino-4,6-dideoxygalactose transaminase
MIKMVDLQSQYLQLKDDIDAAIANVIAQSAFVGGMFVNQFEQAFASYLGARHCVGVGNGTDALEIALASLTLPPGSEVIVPAMSFIAPAEAVTRAGHRVVFCDVDRASFTVSVDDAERRLTEKTRALIVVHLFGRPCAMGTIMSFAKHHDLKVIEDCAQAHGAECGGQRVGTIGDVGAFSFYPTKNLGAFGDAGAIVTNSDSLAEKCRRIANHGRLAKVDHEFEGRNSRLDGMQAAILNIKLRVVEQWTARRIAIAKLYDRAFAGLPNIVTPAAPEPESRHVYHQYVIRTPRRDALREHLIANQIESAIYYPLALPRLNAYRHLGHLYDSLEADTLCAEVLSLPIGDHLTDDQVAKVAHVVSEFACKKAAD